MANLLQKILPWCWSWWSGFFSKQSLESRTVWGGYIALVLGGAMGVWDILQQLEGGQPFNLESSQLVTAGGFLIYGYNTIAARVGAKNDVTAMKADLTQKLDDHLQQQAVQVEQVTAAAEATFAAAVTVANAQ